MSSLFDEAEHKVKVHVPKHEAQHKSKVHVPKHDESASRAKRMLTFRQKAMTLVTMVDLAWDWDAEHAVWVRLAIPPMTIHSGNSTGIWNALRTHPFVKCLHAFQLRLLELANLKCHLTCRGRAGANVRYSAYEAEALPKTWLHRNLV